MTSFSPTQYQAVTDKISSGINTVSQEKLPALTSATSSLIGKWYIPAPVKDAVKWLVDEIVRIAEDVLHAVEKLLEGIAMPIYMFDYAWKWENIKGTATSVANMITPQEITVKDWQGHAASSYTSAIQPQSQAATQIGTIASSTATSMWTCAAGGLAFYILLGIVIFQLIASLVAAIAAVGSIIFSWAGLAMVVADAGVTSGMITAAIAGLVTLLGLEASQMVSLHGEAVDSTNFPGGRWPTATSQ